MEKWTKELKPCPFCGSKAAFDDMTYYEHYCCAIVCTNKYCRVSALRTIYKYHDKQSAIDAWNNRVNEHKNNCKYSTLGDYIRGMDNRELAQFIDDVVIFSSDSDIAVHYKEKIMRFNDWTDLEERLGEELEDGDDTK